MSGRIPAIDLNDILDELKDENNRLNKKLLFANKCIDILNKFKTYLNVIYNKFETHLDSNEIQLLTELEIEYKNHMIDEELNGKQTEQLVIHNRHKTNERENLEKKYIRLRFPAIEQKSQSFVNHISVEEINDKIVKNCEIFKKNNEKQINFRKVEEIKKVFISRHKHRCGWIGCSFKARSLAELEVHHNYHTGDRPFKCSFSGCDKEFVGNQQLTAHIKNVHTLEKTFSCPISGCDMKFNNRTKMRLHLKRHYKHTRFACDFPNCDFKTITKYQLEAHHQRRHTIIEKIHKCNFEGCDKSYRFKNDLDKHSKIHEILENKCDFPNCNREFKNCLGLKRHKRYDHSDNVIDLKCEWPGCEYSTRFPDCYRKHKKVHKTDSDCVCHWPECGKSFKNNRELKLHLDLHSDHYKYSCDWPECGYKAKRYSYLFSHLKTHKRK